MSKPSLRESLQLALDANSELAVPSEKIRALNAFLEQFKVTLRKAGFIVMKAEGGHLEFFVSRPFQRGGDPLKWCFSLTVLEDLRVLRLVYGDRQNDDIPFRTFWYLDHEQVCLYGGDNAGALAHLTDRVAVALRYLSCLVPRDNPNPSVRKDDTYFDDPPSVLD